MPRDEFRCAGEEPQLLPVARIEAVDDSSSKFNEAITQSRVHYRGLPRLATILLRGQVMDRIE